MIKNVYGNSTWINATVHGCQLPYVNTMYPSAGILRLNPNMNRIEVYDGQNWLSIGADTQLDLSENAKEVLMWARNKMEEEQQLQELIGRHPGLKELKDKFEMMKALCIEEEKQQ